jgi:hypothetical protein
MAEARAMAEVMWPSTSQSLARAMQGGRGELRLEREGEIWERWEKWQGGEINRDSERGVVWEDNR